MLEPSKTFLSLPQLADAINKEAEFLEQVCQEALERARSIGIYLLEVKAQLQHGEWIPWIEQNCPTIGYQTAKRYIRIAKKWDYILAQAQDKQISVGSLSYTDALKMITTSRNSKRLTEEEIASEGWVYVIEARLSDKNRYKIGKTQDVDVRFAQIKTYCPVEISLVHTIYCNNMASMEEFLHTKYASKRVQGEWFTLNGEDLEEIKDLLHREKRTV